ncbi:hypothetical protein [Nocardia fluminea]|uniref:hypothetical protein n=1 Tax=Nocardia fluminea TaxID=134984 RepID=UPI003401EC26
MNSSTVRILVFAILSSLVGFWLLDGISLLLSIFGKGFDVSISAKIAATIASVSFAVTVEYSHTIHSELAAHRNEVVEILQSNIRDHLSDSLRKVISNAEFLAISGSSAEAKTKSNELLEELSGIFQALSSMPHLIRTGVLTWIVDPVEELRKSVTDLGSSSIAVSLSQHVAITSALYYAGNGDYVQVNQSAYDVESDWTRDWRDFLMSTKVNPRREVQYIVLGASDYLTSNESKLATMKVFLDQCKVKLLVCRLEDVTDSLGAFTLDSNIDLFDNEVIKTQSVDIGGYRGGVSVNISISSARSRPNLIRTVNAIRESSIPYRRSS